MLSFRQFLLSEAVDQKTAIAKLRQLAKDHYDSFTKGESIDVETIFHEPVDNPPTHGWSDIVKARQKAGGIKLQDVPVKKLIPTQNYVSVGGVEQYIKRPQSQWNTNKEDILNVMVHRGRYYVLGGHHRSAAAILMGYSTVPAEITTLP